MLDSKEMQETQVEREWGMTCNNSPHPELNQGRRITVYDMNLNHQATRTLLKMLVFIIYF